MKTSCALTTTTSLALCALLPAAAPARAAGTLVYAAGEGTAGDSIANGGFSNPTIGLVNAGNVDAALVLNPDGSTTLYLDATQRPYDNAEDSLIGIINNTGHTVTSIHLQGTVNSDIFGFDGDGPGSSTYGVPTPYDPHGYGGPITSFTDLNSDAATANFNAGGIPNGGSTYFAAEQDPAALAKALGGGTITVPAVVPEPTTVVSGSRAGLMGLAYAWHRRRAAAV